MALKDVPQHADVLDVGCGVGAFLDVLRDRREARATGIDLSSEAVAIAQRLGRSASLGDLVNAVEGRIGEFDVVCVFQVLEHVADPRRFLQGCVRLLKPGGRLCVGVPNNDGYLGFQRIEDASLNLPPHHATRWGLRTLRMLERLFPLRLRRLRCEPLARWHVPEYLSAQLDTHHVSDERVRRALRRFGRVALERAGLRRFVRGHTIYASYTRLPTPTDGSQDLEGFGHTSRLKLWSGVQKRTVARLTSQRTRRPKRANPRGTHVGVSPRRPDGADPPSWCSGAWTSGAANSGATPTARACDSLWARRSSMIGRCAGGHVGSPPSPAPLSSSSGQACRPKPPSVGQ